jgi:beta-lactam-binding protein with PASTA domain
VTDPPTDSWPTVDTLYGASPPGPPPPPPPPEPDRRIGMGMLLAITAILLAGAGVAIAYFLTHRDKSSDTTTTVVTTSAGTPVPATAKNKKMPRLIGQNVVAARTTLQRLELQPAVTPTASTQKPGTVLEQSPAAGSKLAPGSTVTLVVAQARSATTASTGTGATTTTTSETTTAETTTTTAPPQPTTATMPDVSSQKEQAAVQSLNSAGILPSLAFVPGTDPLGTVTGQAKAAGATVPYHSHVQINVSSGPGDKPQEQVPNVVGQSLQQAVGTVNGAHLRLIYVKFPVNSRSQAGKIVQQSPLAGGHAPQNAQVLVFLGAFRS